MGRRSAVRDPLAAEPSPPDRARGGFLIGAPFMVLMVVFVRNLLTGFALPAPAAALGVAALLFGMSLLARWLPARHAARVPPSQALRV